MYEAKIELVQAFLSDYDKRIEAEINAHKKSNRFNARGAKSQSATPIAPRPTALVKYMREYRLACNALRDKWKNGP